MSDTVSVDYAFSLIWLVICSFYTTLLTVTALSVVWILRKRRSSILKSQRPTRTPFSELEFNVATPTDNAKSRRVSFSRRTGVAEFVTNEATTTWKNFYEEHNKSLESSSNDSEANASRQPIGHLGKRIFDQQFEEVEAVDFISGLPNGSLNNINFSQQLASLECTGEGKLTAPHNKFELSAFTEQSKPFGNDFTTPSMGDNSGRIDVNFSAIQQIDKDDLDEIEKDLQRGSSNVGCHPFSNEQNISEYIEVDLNTTHVTRNDEDMSITDTVHSPVQDVSKSASIDKKVSLNKDWVADKENIAINPYVEPCESNFAINEEPNQVLVFDGKRLTLQPDIPEKDKNYRQTLLPNFVAETPQRKTIVLNTNDDLPNFGDDILNPKVENSAFNGFHEIKVDEDEISNTSTDIRPKRQTIHENTGNISMTQALPTNIICQTAVISHDINASTRRTIAFNESVTNNAISETVPGKLLNDIGSVPEQHRTVLYETDACNISMTQAIPSKMLVNEVIETINKHNTVVFGNDEGNISVTQAISSNIFEEAVRRKTIVFDVDDGNVSFTQALTANIILPDKLTEDKRPTNILCGNDTEVVPEAIPTNVGLPNNEPNPGKLQTVVYEDDTGNISVTQALPTNILQEIVHIDDIKENNTADKIPTTQSLPNDINVKNNDASRRKTIVYDNNNGNISITQVIPTQLIPGFTEAKDKSFDPFNASRIQRNRKRTTIVYDNDEGDISMTEAIPANIIEEATGETNTKKSYINCKDEADIATTLAISTNVFLLDMLDSAEDIVRKPEDTREDKEKVIDYKVYEEDAHNPTGDCLKDDQNSIVFNADDLDADMSMTMALPKAQSLRETDKRKTVIFDNDNCDISMTKPIPTELITVVTEGLHKTKQDILDETEPNQSINPQADVIVMQASTTNSRPSLHSNTAEHVDLKNTVDLYRNLSDSKCESSINVVEGPIPSSVEDVSASASLLHPKLEMKLNQLNLMSSSSEMNTDKVSEGEDDVLIQTESEGKDTSLPSLLTMSATSVDSGTEDKNFMAHIESNISSDNVQQDTDGKTSNESMFYITKDESNYDTKTDMKTRQEESVQNTTHTHNNTQLEYMEEKPVRIDDLQTQLEELQSVVTLKNEISKRSFKDTVSTDLEDVVEKNDDIKYKMEGHKFKKANDTQELLDMITHFTDNKVSEDDVEPGAVRRKSHTKVVIEPKRLSFAPNRRSIVLSREDMLNNISMAQAGLQKSRLALEDSECNDEDTKDASIDITKMSHCTSSEVVKTLQFDDESNSDTSLKFDTKYSPLKKTAFGETSYMNEAKSKVIPTYLKDVSDGIKELMLDLVKPMNDNLPFDSVVIDKGLAQNPSTHSTQIQANLITSSQVDLECELLCNNDTNTDADRAGSLSGVLSKSRSRGLRSPVKFSGIISEISSDFDALEPKHCSYSPSNTPAKQSDVLVFDHLNPLNNVLLAPHNNSGMHRYNPNKSNEALCDRFPPVSHLNKSSIDKDFEVETVTTAEYRLAIRTREKQEDMYVYKKQDDQFSLLSTSSSKPMSIDQSIDAFATQLKDDQVNTVIAMKTNKELLESSSSLTLVDDAFDGEGRLSSNNEHEKRKIKLSTSNLVDIEEQATDTDVARSLESALIDRTDNTDSKLNITKGKKRIYSPMTDKSKQHQPSTAVTPKPIAKMKKISNSPKPNKVTIVGKVTGSPTKSTDTTQNLTPERDVSMLSETSSEQNTQKSKVVSEKKSPKAKEVTHQPITVQQLLTDYRNLDSDFKHIPEKQLLADLHLNPKSESFTTISQSDVSFTSSKNLNTMKDVISSSTTDYQSPQRSSEAMQRIPGPSQMDWHPDPMSATGSNVCGTDSSVNVVAKIDMLPFMGSHECEWESSSADTWSFRLLHGRLRLSARLEHRHDNATRTRVRGDTPVLNIEVETVQHDRKNPVATMTVLFACETMRYMASRAMRATCNASDIPPLLRRCAAVARVALRWGRAMHDAKLHLAYTLNNEGNLSLKVANIPLRSVWEVKMRIELVLDDNRGVPCPRACGVHVARVVSDVLVSDAEVKRLLDNTPRDWGHAPRTIWRIFRYLKHKTRDDDLLLA